MHCIALRRPDAPCRAGSGVEEPLDFVGSCLRPATVDADVPPKLTQVAISSSDVVGLGVGSRTVHIIAADAELSSVQVGVDVNDALAVQRGWTAIDQRSAAAVCRSRELLLR